MRQSKITAATPLPRVFIDKCWCHPSGETSSKSYQVYQGQPNYLKGYPSNTRLPRTVVPRYRAPCANWALIQVSLHLYIASGVRCASTWRVGREPYLADLEAPSMKAASFTSQQPLTTLLDAVGADPQVASSVECRCLAYSQGVWRSRRLPGLQFCRHPQLAADPAAQTAIQQRLRLRIARRP